MRNFIRLAAPQPLIEKWEEYGKRYIKNRSTNTGFVFQWPQIENQKLNQILLPVLKAQTNDHCSYCDGYPLGIGDETIDHFRPKSNPQFYIEVCKWENLYLSCNDCQDSKGEQYHDLLLRPDELEYSFTKYFIYNYSSHEIETRKDLNANDTLRAEKTKETFNFNHSSRSTSRRHSFERFNNQDSPNIEDYSYRFIFDL